MAETSQEITDKLKYFIEHQNIFFVGTAAKGEAGIRDYWRQNNQQSMDGKPTSIIMEDQ